MGPSRIRHLEFPKKGQNFGREAEVRALPEALAVAGLPQAPLCGADAWQIRKKGSGKKGRTTWTPKGMIMAQNH